MQSKQEQAYKRAEQPLIKAIAVVEKLREKLAAAEKQVSLKQNVLTRIATAHRADLSSQVSTIVAACEGTDCFPAMILQELHTSRKSNEPANPPDQAVV